MKLAAVVTGTAIMTLIVGGLWLGKTYVKDPTIWGDINLAFSPVDEEQIDRSLIGDKKSNILPDQEPSQAVGAIVPHHLLASDFITRALRAIPIENRRRMILIGPNHRDIGIHKVITGTHVWRSKWGRTGSDDEMVNRLLSLDIPDESGKALVGIEPDVVQNEHSIYNIIPFVSNMAPDASVIPLVLSGKLSLQELQTLSDVLLKTIPEGTSVIASVDFSHNLKSSGATRNDAVTQKLIDTGDYQKLLRLGNEFLDSPAAIVLVHLLSRGRGGKHIEILGHSNSGIITGNTDGATTSYFSIIFKDDPL
jgi:MEMO1 family protein